MELQYYSIEIHEDKSGICTRKNTVIRVMCQCVVYAKVHNVRKG